jgi:hypothetical protein
MGRDCASERGQRLEHGRLRGAPRRRKGCWKNVHRRRPARLLIAGRDDVNGAMGQRGGAAPSHWPGARLSSFWTLRQMSRGRIALAPGSSRRKLTSLRRRAKGGRLVRRGDCWWLKPA